MVAGIPQNYPRFRRSARESQWSLSPHRFFIRSIVDADKGFFSQGDQRLVRAEARYRLKEGKGVLIFSRPERLKEWMEANGIDFESGKHLIAALKTLKLREIVKQALHYRHRCGRYIWSPVMTGCFSGAGTASRCRRA